MKPSRTEVARAARLVECHRTAAAPVCGSDDGSAVAAATGRARQRFKRRRVMTLYPVSWTRNSDLHRRGPRPGSRPYLQQRSRAPSGSSWHSSPRCRLFLAAVFSSASRIAFSGSTFPRWPSLCLEKGIVVTTPWCLRTVRDPHRGNPRPHPCRRCAGRCEAVGAPIAGEATIMLLNGSQSALIGSESARALAAGRTLFQEPGLRLSST